MVKFCRDCRWCDMDDEICYRPKPEQFNLVTGVRNAGAQSLPALKERQMESLCGSAGVFFAPKTAS